MSGIAGSDGEIVPGTEHAVHLMYNCTRITREELEDLINKGTWDLDDRVISLSINKIRGLQTLEKDGGQPFICE